MLLPLLRIKWSNNYVLLFEKSECVLGNIPDAKNEHTCLEKLSLKERKDMTRWETQRRELNPFYVCMSIS